MNKRYYLLDMLRGICIIYVVIYHILYDLSEVFGRDYTFFQTNAMEVIRICFVSVLVVLSGISCNFSRNNLKRGIVTFLWGMGITAVTTVILPSEKVLFGVLHFFGVAMVLYHCLKPLFKRVPIALGVLAGVTLFLLTWNIRTIVDPFVPDNLLCYCLGICTGYESGDYYPVFPWFFLFVSGSFLGRLFHERSVPSVFYSNPIPMLTKLGQHTLIIYLAHQPVAYGICYVYFNLI